MIKTNIKIDTDQRVQIGECYLEIDLSIERIIVEGCNMITIIEVTLGEEILGGCKIIEAKLLDLDIDINIKMEILEEVDVGLEKDSI